MADISQEINDFKNAIYGEEVRGSMISLAEKLNTEVEENTTNVNQAVSTANSASSAANQAVQDANTTLQAANQAVTSAAGSASAAAGSASAAAEHATDAEESATAAANSAAAAAKSAADAAEAAEGLEGFNGKASSVTAQDVEGLLGSPGAQSNVQALIDAIADQVLNQLVKKSQIINNLLATQAGNVLDATQGKALKDLIDQLNSDMQNKFARGSIVFLESGANYNTLSIKTSTSTYPTFLIYGQRVNSIALCVAGQALSSSPEVVYSSFGNESVTISASNRTINIKFAGVYVNLTVLTICNDVTYQWINT